MFLLMIVQYETKLGLKEISQKYNLAMCPKLSVYAKKVLNNEKVIKFIVPKKISHNSEISIVKEIYELEKLFISL